jgi:Holliday junction DNA helicase RuvA
MIATLRGQVTQVEDNAIILETGGFGMRVSIPKPLREKLEPGDAVFLYTHMVIREDDWKIFGFDNQLDRSLFSTLLSVDGVGPRTALAIISTLDHGTVQRAVFTNEPHLLTQAPGVGLKTAEKIILSLKDKLKPSDGMDRLARLSENDSEVLAALVSLGYSVVEAQNAIQTIPKDTPDDVEIRLRTALQYFSN